MVKICLCFNIHIPAIQSYYRFFNIKSQHRYFDDARLKSHTLKVYSSNLLPFLETLKFLRSSSGEKFKAAISISGITLALFKRFVPKAIEILNELYQENAIELLSETWSNSILAHISNSLLVRQISLHDAQMRLFFGVVPDVFISHSPVSSPELFNTVFDSSKKMILTYSNPVHKIFSGEKDDSEFKSSFERNVFLINYMDSKKLFEIDLKQKRNSMENLISSACEKVKRDISGSMAQALIFNPADIKMPFTFENSLIWKMIISCLIADEKVRLIFPSELKNGRVRILNKNRVDETGNRCKLPDFWMKNSLQKDAFKRLVEIDNDMSIVREATMIEEWDLLHDMDYLYYMDNHFFKPEFTEKHFNPFSGPYAAYINYMNILDDFNERLTDKRKEHWITKSVYQNSE